MFDKFHMTPMEDSIATNIAQGQYEKALEDMASLEFEREAIECGENLNKHVDLELLDHMDISCYKKSLIQNLILEDYDELEMELRTLSSLKLMSRHINEEDL